MTIIQTPTPTLPDQSPASVTDEVSGSILPAARKISDRVGQAVTGSLESAREAVADGVDEAAYVLFSAADELSRGPNRDVAGYVEEGVDALQTASAYLHRSSYSQLLLDSGELLRRQPIAGVASAFVVGLLLGRFFKSASPAVDRGDNRLVGTQLR